MSDQKAERIWRVTEQDSATLVCRSCEKQLHVNDEAVLCPRCKGPHHLSCWIDKGGCATHGCSQLADPSLTAGKTRRYDPPAKGGFAWLPMAITGLLLILVIGGALWTWINGSSKATALTIMAQAGPDIAAITQIAKEFDDAHDELKVSVMSIPEGPQGTYYEEKLVIMLATKEAPDIIILPYDRFTEYVKLGALTSLDAIQASVSSVPYGARLSNGKVAGHLYGVPHPSRAGIFAIPIFAPFAEEAQQLLISLAKQLPFKPGINDKALVSP